MRSKDKKAEKLYLVVIQLWKDLNSILRLKYDNLCCVGKIVIEINAGELYD